MLPRTPATISRPQGWDKVSVPTFKTGEGYRGSEIELTERFGGMNTGHTLPTGYHIPLHGVCTVQDCSTLLSAFAFQSQYIFLHSCILDKILEEPLLGLSGTET